jgi:serine phosphatase RsbU (regulator of sigma subunit)
VAVSDGVTEATAPDGTDFGMERLIERAVAHHRDQPSQLLADLLDTVDKFSEGAPPSDDRTVAVVRYIA